MNRYLRWGLIGLSVLAVLAATGAVFPMLFYLNDDVMMRSILSGAYLGVPDGHAVYMKYPLTGLLASLYRITDRVPWFSLFLSGSFWLSGSLVLGRLADCLAENKNVTRGKKLGIFGGMALACVPFFLPQYAALHYTVAAAVLGGCGIYLVLLGSLRGAAVLLVLCFCVRSQVFFLALPFLGLALLWMLWERRERRLFQFAGALGICVLICALWDGWMYRSEDWKQYREYNEARTQLYDYQDLLPYEQYQTEYEAAGVEEPQYRLLEEYDLGLNREEDIRLLEQASAVYEEQSRTQEDKAAYGKKCLTEYYYHARYTDKPFNVLAILAYGAVAALALWQRRWLQLFLTACLGGGRSLIWLYLIWRGRFPERIEISLYLLEFMLLAGLLCRMLIFLAGKKDFSGKGNLSAAEQAAGAPGEETSGENPAGEKGLIGGKWLWPGAGLVLLACFLWAGSLQVSHLREQIASQLKQQEKWDALTAYCQEQEDSFYLLNVMSMVSYGGRVWEDTGEEENYMLAGGWMSASPLMWKKMEALGAADGGALLAGESEETGKKVLYVASAAKDTGWLSEELSRRFGPVEMVQTDSIELYGEEQFRIYGFMRK